MFTGLERCCQLLLHAYPAEYRAERGDEIVATLLDTARPGQRLPAAADAADVVRAGLRQRIATVGPLVVAGAQVAAPFALALAAGVSAYLWWRVEPITVHKGWPYQTLGPLAYAAWILALAVRALLSASAARAATIAAAVLTLVTPVLGALTPLDRPPLWTIALLTGLGALALTARPAGTDERLALPVGAVAICVVTITLARAWPADPRAPAYYQPREVGGVLALTAVVVLTLAVRRPAAAIAATLLAVPVGWLGPYAASPGFGRLAEVLLASCIGGAAVIWLRGHPASAAARAGWVGGATLGNAFGLACFLSTVGANRYAQQTVFLLAAAGVFGSVAARRLRLGWCLVGAVGGLAAAWLVAVYDNGWSASGSSDPDHTASLIATVAFVPFSICAIAAVRALITPARSLATGTAAAVMLGLSLAWLIPATLPYALSWGPQLAVLLGCLCVSTMSQRRTR